MAYEASPAARALLVLELIQNSPGVTADQLADRLGLSDRAVRRYVGVLRDAGIPIESTRGRYGGYRTGRGLRVPPLMFTHAEALGLVMAVLAGHGAPGATDPVGSALSKLIRVLPEPLARPADAVRGVRARNSDPTGPDPQTTALLVQSCGSRRLRLGYRRSERDVVMDVDPWAVVLRHGRWYLLCWSHTVNARRVLRVDRVTEVQVVEGTVAVPADLDPMRALEEHMSEGWRYPVEVLVDAPAAEVARCFPRGLGRLEPVGADRTRLVASTDEPGWYAEQLTLLRAPFQVVGSPEIRDAVEVLGRRLVAAIGSLTPA